VLGRKKSMWLEAVAIEHHLREIHDMRITLL